MFAFYQTLFTVTASLTRTSVDGGQVWSPWFHHGIRFLPLFVTNNLFLPKHSSSKSICSCLEHYPLHICDWYASGCIGTKTTCYMQRPFLHLYPPGFGTLSRTPAPWKLHVVKVLLV